jgi:hypothetical protein
MATRRAAALAVLVAALACPSAALARAPVVPPGGYLFTWIKAPAETNFSATPIGSKVGVAKTHYLNSPVTFYYVPIELAFGDAAVKKAADEAGITTIHFVDYEFINVLNIYQRMTIRVFGD